MTIGPKYAARLLMTCILILTSTTAYACSCASYDTITERVESTSVIFLGEVKKTRKSWSFWRSERKTTFDVIETYKGELSEKVKISHPTENRGNCGIDFKKRMSLLYSPMNMAMAIRQASAHFRVNFPTSKSSLISKMN